MGNEYERYHNWMLWHFFKGNICIQGRIILIESMNSTIFVTGGSQGRSQQLSGTSAVGCCISRIWTKGTGTQCISQGNWSVTRSDPCMAGIGILLWKGK